MAYLRNLLYDRGWLPVYRVGIPVVSIGNLSVGGTGKTPLVILFAQQFKHRKVAILARGYRAENGQLNDEMRVIQRHVPEASLYQDGDRVALARQAEADGAELILLDDGFQHRRLHRDFDCVVVRPEDFSDRYLPQGLLRDSPKQLRRAHALFSYAPVAQAIQLGVQPLVSEDLRGKAVGLFCGIGHPERFKKTVAGLGAFVLAELYIGDHEPIGERRLRSFYEKCKPLGIRYLVCTEKDWVKLPVTELPILCVSIQARVVANLDAWKNLLQKIEKRL
ncbi:MAG: tetraacyldisaccharide 4'-kinase [Verrucomicrobiota bacterium]|nr:tetraacyldisaccharide 4'-kinase [Verrucomicrobiota bacterium]